jgi:hypothetical protein
MKYWPGSNILKSKNNAFDWRNWKQQIKWVNAPINKVVTTEADITDLRKSIIVLKDDGSKPGILNFKI